MKIMTSKSTILFLLIGMWLLAPVNAMSADAKDMLGKQAPDFVLPSLSGDFISLSDWQGKVRVVNFWASWCVPCRKEIPMFNRLQKEYGNDDVQFIGIAIDNVAAIKTFMKKIPIDYPVSYGMKATTALIQAYGDEAGVLPYTVFVDRRGNIQIIAPGQLKEDFTRRSLEKLM